MYVSMKNGKENAEKILRAVPAWIFFHSVISVMPPSTKRRAHALKTVSINDHRAIVMSPPETAPMMP